MNNIFAQLVHFFYQPTHKRITLSEYLTIIAIILGSSLLVYLPFLFHSISWLGFTMSDVSMDVVYKNFDGLLYVVPAKTWYNPAMIESMGVELPLSAKYYAAHLPLYPVFIALFSPVLGYVKSMLFVNLFSTVLLGIFFVWLLKRLQITQYPLVLLVVFMLLPRFFVVRTVGAPESLFMFFILASLYFFEKKQYLWAGVIGGLATMTKTPGILLFVAYGLTLLEQVMKTKKFHWQSVNLLFIPLGLLLVFFLYHLQYGDFWAYFNTGGVVPMPYLFSAFNFQAKWLGTAWVEDILFYFFLYLLTVITLKNSPHRSFFYFTLVFFVATTFVQHRDIARYSLPLWPLACIAFQEFFTSKKFMLVLLILLPAILLYVWNFLLFNIMPVGNWQPYL